MTVPSLVFRPFFVFVTYEIPEDVAAGPALSHGLGGDGFDIALID
jgi:hypothetical protein